MKRNRRNDKMTMIGFVSNGRVQWTGSIFIFGIGVPPSTFVMLTFLLMLLQRINSYADGSNADDLQWRKLQRRRSVTCIICCTPYVEFHNAIDLLSMNG